MSSERIGREFLSPCFDVCSRLCAKNVTMLSFHGCRIKCLKDSGYAETVTVSFDHMEVTASCADVLIPFSWL